MLESQERFPVAGQGQSPLAGQGQSPLAGQGQSPLAGQRAPLAGQGQVAGQGQIPLPYHHLFQYLYCQAPPPHFSLFLRHNH